MSIHLTPLWVAECDACGRSVGEYEAGDGGPVFRSRQEAVDMAGMEGWHLDGQLVACDECQFVMESDR